MTALMHRTPDGKYLPSRPTITTRTPLHTIVAEALGRILITERSMTFTVLGQRCGIARQTIHAYLRGVTLPRNEGSAASLFRIIGRSDLLPVWREWRASIVDAKRDRPFRAKEKKLAPTNILGAWLREARHQRGWTQGVAADMIGVEERTFANWECGRSRPRNMMAVTAVLGPYLTRMEVAS